MNQTRRHLLALAAISLLVPGAGCSDRNPTELDVARANIDPVVFDDAYSADVYFQPFLDTMVEAARPDSVFAYGGLAFDGARSVKITVPPAGSSLGYYAGGVMTSGGARDLTDYNALTFYARTHSIPSLEFNVIGFGNDNTGTSRFEAGIVKSNLFPGTTVTNEWTFYVVPIPAPHKLVAERGLFSFAEGAEAPLEMGYEVWFDEIKFAKVDNLGDPIPVIDNFGTREYFVGTTVDMVSTYTAYQIDGAWTYVSHSPNYFDYTSSDPDVAIVENGQIKLVGPGDTEITAVLEETEVVGSVPVRGHLPPTTAPVPPTLPAADVISLFSDVYDDVPVDTWLAEWSSALVSDYAVDGDNMKVYSNFRFAGIIFVNPTVDASDMTHIHLDVYAPSGSTFKVKFTSFPPGLDPQSGMPDLIFNASTTPAFASGAWSPLDIPLTDFDTSTSPDWDWSNIGEIVIASDDATVVLVDNVYFHR